MGKKKNAVTKDSIIYPDRLITEAATGGVL